ncbi:hypothetical protein BZARG_1476 [Bizionia argentinensis JUB59]|uniref:Uncharacterized protein n=1 Tax=Bizionia argentinensis JUB59 TaxID=1046627 RepID=G2EC52_9FLAO|nr:hypothetical protein [Bizionia argentinensis]EGV44013.1 hypothetical protein BZARG_1476 [Bizionia argentinensis JUB59]
MIKKHIKRLSFIVVILSHLGFLVAILIEQQNSPFIVAFIILMLLLLLITYKKTPLSAENHVLEHVLTIGFVFIGAIATYGLYMLLGLSSVLAASLIGLVVSFIPDLFKKSKLIQGMPTAVYCGTFVGMTNISIAPDYIFITLASFISGFLLIGTKNTFHGVGGKLGTLAFGGVTIAFFITLLITKWL